MRAERPCLGLKWRYGITAFRALPVNTQAYKQFIIKYAMQQNNVQLQLQYLIFVLLPYRFLSNRRNTH